MHLMGLARACCQVGVDLAGLLLDAQEALVSTLVWIWLDCYCMHMMQLVLRGTLPQRRC
jgi:hypothetical protein